MTKYVYPKKLVADSTDIDGPVQTLSIYRVGLTNTPTIIDWSNTNVVTFPAWTTGTIEVYQDGTIIYDDHGIVSNHPYSSAVSSILNLYFQVTDGIDPATNVAVEPLTITAASSGDVVAPTFSSLFPAVNSTNVAENTDPTLTYSETIQQGVSGKTITLWNATTAAAIQVFTIPGDIGSGAGKIYISGSTVTIQPTTNLPKGTKVAIRWDVGFVKDLSGNDIAAVTDDSISFDTVPVVSSVTYPDDPLGWRGRSPNVDFDPTGALIVDPTGAGGAYTTINAANTAAVAGNKISVKYGRYDEQINLKSGVTLEAWHTDRPILSAQQDVTGFVQCNASDATILGPVLGVANSPVYKRAGLAKSLVPITDLLGLAPMENWVPLFNAQDRANPNDFDFQEDESKFYDVVANGGNYVLSGINIVGVTDSSVINSSRYTNAQLLLARARYFGKPNEIYSGQITSANVATGTIGWASSGKEVDGSNKKRFALQNIAPAMVAGTFFYVDNGTTFDLYVYPYNSANINKITMVARKTIITLPDTGSDIAIRGFKFAIGSGPGSCEGTAICKVSNGVNLNNVTIEHNEFIGGANTGQLHYAQVWLTRTHNILMQYNSFKWSMAHGIYLTGSLVNQNVATIRRNVFARCGSAGSKAYNQNKYSFMHNYSEWCGYRSHGNLGNVYAGGLDAVWWGNQFEFCMGYLTCQNMQNPNYCFNKVPTDNKYIPYPSDRDNRKINNQNASGVCYTFNNDAFPVFTGLANQGHMALIPDDPGMTCHIANNITHGMLVPGDMAGTIALCKYNLITHSAWSGPVGQTLDAGDFNGAAGKFDTTNVFQATVSLVFVDYANRNWAWVSGSPARTMGTYDITSVITGYFIPTFTGGSFNVPIGDFYLDYYGGPINYSALKMGGNQAA